MFPRFCHAFTVKPFPKIKHTEIVYRVTNAVGIPGEELLFIPFRVGWVPTEITFISNVVNLQSSQNIRGRIFAGRAGKDRGRGPRSRKSFHGSSDWLHATPRQIYALLIAVFLPRVVARLFQDNIITPRCPRSVWENLSTRGRVDR